MSRPTPSSHRSNRRTSFAAWATIARRCALIAAALATAACSDSVVTSPKSAIAPRDAAAHDLAPAGSLGVLIYGPSVLNGASSLEAQAAGLIGQPVTVVDAAQWSSMTAGQFSQYRAIILGDPRCSFGYLGTPIANRNVWGPVVNGNVFVIGTDPTYHAPYSPGAAEVIRSGVKFAADAPGKTGAYITLSCDAGLVSVLGGLSTLGTFATGPAPCGATVAKVADHPALSTLTAASLSGWGCSVHETFTSWPSDFDVLAIALDGGNAYTAPDGTKGTPYVLARGEGLVIVSDIQLTPGTVSLTVGQTQVLTATVKSNGAAVVGKSVTFTVVDGPDAGQTANATTDGNGVATYSLTRSAPGTDGVRATFVDALGRTQTSNRAAVEWTVPADATPPVITPVVTGTAGEDGWYVSDIGLTWTVVDNESPITSKTGCDASSVTSDNAGVTFTCTAVSTGGTATKSITLMRDASAPSLDVNVSGPQGANDWYTGTVTVTWIKSDPTSGVRPFHTHDGTEDPCLDRTLTTNTASVTYSCTIENGAGLKSTKSVTVKRDATPPTVVGTPSGSLGNNGWYVGDVTVNWTTADDVSGATPCASNTLSTDNAGTSYTCTTTNGAGMTASGSVTVKRDGTKPVIGYSGNAGTYTVDQTVAITCSASDAMSGLAGTTCANVGGDAYTFGLGAHTYSATAADRAGNTNGASTTFTVNVTPASLCALTRRFVSNAGVANSLCQKLDAAEAAFSRGQADTAHNILSAYVNEVQAQSGGKFLSSANAAILISLAQAM